MAKSSDQSLVTEITLPLASATLTIPPWATLSSGAVSGLASCLLLQPVDLLKTRMQQQALPGSKPVLHKSRTAKLVATFNGVLREDGVKGFWRGTVPTVARNVPGVSIYMYSVAELRQIVSAAEIPYLSERRQSRSFSAAASTSSSSSSTLTKLSTAGNMLTGAAARTAVGFCLSPITIVKARYEVGRVPVPEVGRLLLILHHPQSSNFSRQQYPSLISALAHIYRTAGVRGLFQGFSATALRDAPYAGLYLAFYEQSKTTLGAIASSSSDASLQASNGDGRGGALVVSLSGLLAGAAATLLTHPFDIIKTRMQTTPVEALVASGTAVVRPGSHKPPQASLLSTTRHLLRTSGPQAFLDGLGLRCARKAASSAIGWSIFEWGRGSWVRGQTKAVATQGQGVVTSQ